MDNRFSLTARAAGYHAIGSLCSGQNFMDGPMRINHFGMPDRPFFVSPDDFRKAGPGGRGGLVGLPQCQRNTFLNREYNCTYCLEPAWNEYYNEGGGSPRGIDDVSMSRMFDFFEAMLQNRLSQKALYCFSVGLEFNGVASGITESNRMLIDYAVRKATTEPLVFSTGPAVADYYRRHFARTPETTCFQQDYFAGLTKLDKPAGYPDTLEVEGPDFQSLLRTTRHSAGLPLRLPAAVELSRLGKRLRAAQPLGCLTLARTIRLKWCPRSWTRGDSAASAVDADHDGQLEVRLTVKAPRDQQRLVLALWELGRLWRRGEGWWRVGDGPARFVPVHRTIDRQPSRTLRHRRRQRRQSLSVDDRRAAAPARAIGISHRCQHRRACIPARRHLYGILVAHKAVERCGDAAIA